MFVGFAGRVGERVGWASVMGKWLRVSRGYFSTRGTLLRSLGYVDGWMGRQVGEGSSECACSLLVG